MEKHLFYVAPEIDVEKIYSDGILCLSDNVIEEGGDIVVPDEY